MEANAQNIATVSDMPKPPTQSASASWSQAYGAAGVKSAKNAA
jgi:hypothetical protein